jgi:hypothetical protein
VRIPFGIIFLATTIGLAIYLTLPLVMIYTNRACHTCAGKVKSGRAITNVGISPQGKHIATGKTYRHEYRHKKTRLAQHRNSVCKSHLIKCSSQPKGSENSIKS